MRFILLILLSPAVWANSFSLPETGSRFNLSITPESFTYSSEALNEKIKATPCHLPIFNRFNAQMMSYLPQKEVKSGFKYIVDEKVFMLDLKDAKPLVNMDEKIVLLLLEMKQKCK